MSIQAFIAANRFGLGAAPGDLNSIAADPRGWLLEQIDRPARNTPDYGLPDSASLAGQLLALKKEREQDKKAGDPADAKGMFKEIRDQALTALQARFTQNMTSPQPFLERLTLFWSNHFTVSIASKPFIAPLAVTYERDAIRPYILGRFEDMLLEGTRHPAMLIYLDNATSVGPNSQAGRRRNLGLNENLARETLELHSLGVDGGYTQTDVTNLAKIITGWTVGAMRPNLFARAFIQNDGLSDGFNYIDILHEPGPQILMGKTYGQGGIEQGETALRDLAAHPATAKFLATKLARHFIADDPPPGDVEQLAAVYMKTDGDLAEVSRTLVGLESVWQNPLSKVKTPYELVLSSLKAVNAPADKIPYQKIHGSLKILDNAPFGAPSPAGWSDKADDWISGNAVMNRIEWCHALAAKIPVGENPANLAQDILGPALNPDTLTAIRRAPSPSDGLALMLASAEFQRR